MNEIDRKNAELALVKGIVLVSNPRPGRMRGLIKRLGREVDRELMRLPVIPKERFERVAAKLQEWERESGWAGKGKHICTYASFCLDLIDARPWPKVKAVLVDIIDHYDRVGAMPAACCWSGALARERFEEVVG